MIFGLKDEAYIMDYRLEMVSYTLLNFVMIFTASFEPFAIGCNWIFLWIFLKALLT
jgi:hypothetical protein